ncbi:MAG: stalk domain-containing protein [Candidatus Cryosericum sp.]
MRKVLAVVLVVALLMGLFITHGVARAVVPGGIPVLVLQSGYPWGKSEYLSIMTSLGYVPTTADWAAVGTTVHLEDFRYLYIPSVQESNSFYANYTARMSEIAAWVAGGGRLLFSFCTQGASFSLPGGATQVHGTASNNHIVDASHPIVTGVLSDGIALTDANLLGSSCSHNYLTALPESAHTILQYAEHGATLAEYDYGSGHVVASGLTWEFYVAPYGSPSGSGAFALRAFDDVILYTFPKVMHTITASAGAGGAISPSGAVTVVDGASKPFVITANLGNSIASVVVDGAAAAVTNHSQMTYTFESVTADHSIQAMFMTPDMLAPTIAFPLELTGSGTVRYRSLALLLDVRDNKGDAFVQVWVNGVKVAGGSQNGPYTYNLSLAEGANAIYVTATDAAGNLADATLKVTTDSTAPALSAHIVKNGTAISVVGSAVDAGSGMRSLVVGEQDMAVGLDGDFSVPVQPKVGASSIVIEATDNAGNTATVELTLTQPTKPVSSYKTVTLTIGKTSMDVNGMPVAMDAAPVIKNSRTLLPIRALIETLGGKVAWDGKTRTATVTLGEHSVVLVVGKSMALVDGKSVPIDAANGKVVPEIIGSRTYLPLRFIAENLGLDLTWEPVSQTISFTYWP